MDRNLQLLGIAKKAGLLAVGSDDVSAAARTGKAWLVVSASDASAGALRRAGQNAGSAGVVHIVAPYTKFEIGNVSRRGSPGTVAVLDAGLAAGFLKGLAEAEPERYGSAAELMAEEAAADAERKKNTPSGKRRPAGL